MTLIKLHKRRVDVLRREMILLEDERKELISLSERLDAEYNRERDLAGIDPKMAGFFGPYSRRMADRQKGIRSEIARLDTAIEAKVEEIREEFAEQKKYEIAQEYARKRHEIELKRQQQLRFDEIGSQQYYRNQAEDKTS